MKQKLRIITFTLLVVILGYAFIPSVLAANPTVTGTTPANAATNVARNTGLVATVNLTHPGFGVDEASLTPATVRLIRNSDGSQVPGVLNTTGGGDAIIFQPSVYLDPNTAYTWQITGGVRDTSGAVDANFVPYNMTFTTGTAGGPPPAGPVHFDRVTLGLPARPYTSVTIGPDGRLYGATATGNIYHWNIQPDGTLTNEFNINLVAGRVVIGMAFDPASTPANPILWVTHNFGGLTAGPHFSGAVARMTVTNLGAGGETWTGANVIIGLPRSIKDHLTNSLAFGPDGALYLTQGSISAMGDRDNAWGLEPETLLSASVLRINTGALLALGAALPLNVATGIPEASGDLLDANNFGFGSPGLAANNLYDPQAPGAPVTIYASGVRNAFDLVWHTNGTLYAATNGSAGGGSVPPTPGTLPVQCNNRIDDGFNGNYTGPAIGATTSPGTQPDLLYRIVANGFYGHPNPTRCEWVMNGGDPTAGVDPFQVPQYADGTQPDRNWRGATHIAYNFGNNASADGSIEYRSNTFGGALQGRLLVIRYSLGDDIVVLTPGAGGNIATSQVGLSGLTGFVDPLDLTEDRNNGNLYVTEYGANRITLLRPGVPPAPNIEAVPNPVILSDTTAAGASTARTVTIRNLGPGVLSINALTLTGGNAANFAIQTPPALPITLAAGGTLQVNVTFTAPAADIRTTTLRIASNDPDTPNYDIQLRGLGFVAGGGNNEPSLQRILDTYRIGLSGGDQGIDVGDNDSATTPINSNNAIASGGPFADEVDAQSFRRTTGSTAPVTIEPLAVFGVNATPVLQLGWYNTGNIASTNSVFNVNLGSSQTLNPVISGTTSFNPGNTVFGFYTIWTSFANRRVYSEDAFNTFAGAFVHHVRVYPLQDAAGVVVPNAYVVGFEEFTSGYDYNDIVFIVRNVEPVPLVPPPPGGEITLENTDWDTLRGINPSLVMYEDRLVFSRINGFAFQGELSHDNVVLRIRNNGITPLTINSMAITGVAAEVAYFDLPNNEDTTPPPPIPAGGSYDLTVRMIAGPGAGTVGPATPHSATLVINSTDADEPVTNVTLAGTNTYRPEANVEPPLQMIVNTFGWTTNTGTNVQADYVADGEEVLSPTWRRVDAGQPVYVRQIAALHGQGSDNITITGAGGGSINHYIDDFQSFLPYRRATDGTRVYTTEMTITPSTTSFNVTIAGYNSNRGSLGQSHAVRFWPLRDRNGVVVPNAWIVGQDFVGSPMGCGSGSTNCDYQDNAYIITNIAPATVSTDVSVTIVDDPDPVGTGGNVTYTLSVRNNGLVQAPGVILSNTLPGQATYISSTSSQGACSYISGEVSCNLGNLAPETTATITIVVGTTTIGSMNNTAIVSFSGTDTNPANNSDTETTLVDNPANVPNRIVIIKEATPEGNTPFLFSSTMGDFTLTDPGAGSPAVNARFNFQPTGVTPPVGYIAETGDPYGTDGNYGWVTNIGHNPLDLSLNTRIRTVAGLDIRLRTIIHMQYSGASGNTTPGAWEYAVPNGIYNVVVSVGDQPGSGGVYDSRHTMRVEGAFVPGIVRWQGSAAEQYRQGSIQVVVTDGRITIDPGLPSDPATYGTNTKLNYLEITSAPPNSRVFSNLAPGTYNIAEVLPVGWSLSGATCTGGATNPITNGVSIPLAGGQSVTCTFTNTNSVPTAAIDIEITPDTQAVGVGTDAPFTVTVRNIGTAALSNISITSSTVPNCNRTFPTLPTGVGGVQTYTCTATAVAAAFTNTVTAVGTPPAGANVTDADSAQVTLTTNQPGTITIVKNATPDSNQPFNFIAGGGSANFTLADTGATPVNPIRVNFQSAVTSVAPGYISDYGAAFGVRNGAEYGWFSVATGLAFNASAQTRTRTPASADPRLDTLMQMEPTSGGTEVYWEYTVPNGVYRVTVSVGDRFFDSTHTINVEGVTIPNINGITLSAAEPYRQGTVVVTVTDGRITINSAGGTNTKINYVDIDSVPNTQVFSNVAPGTYDITEVVPAGWSLTGVTCAGGTGNPIANGVSIVLGGAQNITCTFNNTQGLVSNLVVTPTALNFGNQVITTTSTAQNFTLRNNGPVGAPAINVTALAIAGTDPTQFAMTLPVLPIVLQPGQEVQIPVTFTPTTTGPKSAVINVTHDGANAATPQPVNLTGTGITTNNPPDAVDDTATTTVSTPVNIAVLTNDTDPDPGTTLVIDAVGVPAPSGTAVINGTTIDFTPAAGFTGVVTFQYRIIDGSGGQDIATVTVNVNAVNTPPTAVDDAATAATATLVNIAVLTNDTDPDPGTTLTITAVSVPSNGTAAINGTTIDYTSGAGFTGTATFTYTISDGNGGTDIATVTVTVNPANNPPNAVNDTANTTVGTLVNIAVLANDTDPDPGTTLTITAVGTPSNGTAVINGTTIDYTPGAGFTGTAVFTYTISDGNGGTDNGIVNVNVGITNNPPDAVDDTATTLQGTLVTITVLANDTDADLPADTLTPSLLTPAANGTATLVGNTFSYLPNPAFSGTDTFTYRLTDAAGGSDVATVTITVTAVVNNLPDAVDDAIATNEDTPVNINVLANDTDPDAGQTLSIAIITQPINGTAVINGTTVDYVPNLNYSGVDSFTYTISDGFGGTDTATVNITVAAVNDNPTAGNDIFIITLDVTGAGTVTVTPPGVLVNDTDPDTGATLTAAVTVQPTFGTVVMLPDGSFVYTLLAGTGFATADSFTYTVSDGAGGTATATVVISIGGTSPAIEIDVTPDTQSVAPNSNISLTVRVRNSGDTPLTNINVTSALGCNQTIVGLLVGSDQYLTCAVSNVTTDFSATFSVAATTITGTPVSDDDTVVVTIITNTVSNPAGQTTTTVALGILAADPFITKIAQPPFAIPGEAVTFIFTITNPNNAAVNNVRAVDPMPAEVEVLGASAPSGTVTVNGQDVVFEIATLGANETVTVTINTRVRDNVSTPYVIVNRVCMNGDGFQSEHCATASVSSVSVLPTTGESLRALQLRYALVIVGIIAFAGVTTLQIKRRRSIAR